MMNITDVNAVGTKGTLTKLFGGWALCNSASNLLILFSLRPPNQKQVIITKGKSPEELLLEK
jgi:hypothetical protein